MKQALTIIEDGVKISISLIVLVITVTLLVGSYLQALDTAFGVITTSPTLILQSTIGTIVLGIVIALYDHYTGRAHRHATIYNDH